MVVPSFECVLPTVDTFLGHNRVGLSSTAFTIGNALRGATWKALSHMGKKVSGEARATLVFKGISLTLTHASLTGGVDAISSSSVSDRKHGQHVNLSKDLVLLFRLFF